MAKTNNRAPSRRVTVIALLRSLSTDLFDPYRPERHYMRGPGPKWREKHQIVPARAGFAASATVAVRGLYAQTRAFGAR